MPETLVWTFYDEATLATTAAVEHQLFATPMGASGRSRYITNSPSNASMKNTESFVAWRIQCWLDSVEVVADLEEMFLQSYIRITINNKEMLSVPLMLCGGGANWTGAVQETTASNKNLINMGGLGYSLEKMPLVFPKASPFEVWIGQGLALANACQLKFSMSGLLTRD